MYATDWVHTVRERESQLLLRLLEVHASSAARLLEVGAGDGFMAEAIARGGYAVTATDPAPRKPARFEVQASAGHQLPADDATIDVVYSSNVLEHIEDLDAALREFDRVLAPEGLQLHALPTVACNLWTMALQPLAYLRNLGLVARGDLRPPVVPPDAPGARLRRLVARAGFAWSHLLPHRLLLGPPHGIGLTRLSALVTWSRARWRRRFARAGYEVITIERLPLAFSQHKLLPGRVLGLRRRLGPLAGSVDVYALRRRAPLRRPEPAPRAVRGSDSLLEWPMSRS